MGNLYWFSEELPDEFTIPLDQNLEDISTEDLTEDDISALCGSCNNKTYKKIKSWTHSNNHRFGWHPQFPKAITGASGYWFSVSNNTSFSVSLSLAKGLVSVSVASSGNSAGYYISTKHKKSRPAVYGKLTLTEYQVTERDGAGRVKKTYKETLGAASNTSVKIDKVN